jgi:hypothetical protein
MGNIRVPKNHYFKYGVVQFYVKSKEIHFKIYLWIENGSKRILIRDSKFNITIEQIIAEIPTQSFTNVEVEQ